MFAFTFTFQVQNVWGALCPKWETAQQIASVNSKIVDELSGFAVSRTQESFYYVNDSGTGPEFFVSRRDGSQLKSVRVDDYKPVDPEDLAIGPCPLAKQKTCLMIADIGDNLKRRKSIKLVFIEEKSPWPSIVKPHFVAQFKYPDQAHNAEASALLSSGDVVIVTKELSIVGNKASTAQVYRATAAQILKAKEPTQLVHEGTIDVPKITKQDSLGGGVTSMAVTDSNDRFALLTYSTAIEFDVDLRKPFPKVIETSKLVPLFQLPQQESIAYDRDNRDLIYGTEIRLTQRYFGKGQPVPLYKVKCSL